MILPKLRLPVTTNYVAAFLTFDCPQHCPYCIVKHDKFKYRKAMDGDDWVTALTRIQSSVSLPVTLQGGEPTAHQEFYDITNELLSGQYDLLTSLSFDVAKFMEEVSSYLFKRNAPYASIRASYHPNETSLESFIYKVLCLQRYGYQVGVYMVTHPKWDEVREALASVCKELDIDYRNKDFLGEWKGLVYGTYAYPGSVKGELKRCECKGSELLIAPDGYVFKCHSDLYANEYPIGHILDKDFRVTNKYRECYKFGSCNPCDVKITNDRFQKFGHCSVKIIDSPTRDSK